MGLGENVLVFRIGIGVGEGEEALVAGGDVGREAREGPRGGHGLGKGGGLGRNGGCLPIKEDLCLVAGVKTLKRQLLYDLTAS